MDTHFVWNAILTIGMTIISGLIALGAKYLNQIQKTFEAQLKNQDKKIDQLRDDYKNDMSAINGKLGSAQGDLGDFKILVQREFVNRDEHIRTTQSLDAKIDRVLNEISKIQVNVAKLAATQGVSRE